MSQELDLTNCDREPIHIPGSIQPHGMMLVVDRNSLVVSHSAGDIEHRLGVSDWQGASLGRVLGDSLAGKVAHMADSGAVSGFVSHAQGAGGEVLDISAHLSGEWLVVELEPGEAEPQTASVMMSRLAHGGAVFERAMGLKALCERAAEEFRQLTGFDRVMIYQFIDDGAGAVLAEDKVDDLPSFLNQHFPGSDIPRQARALYVRNRVRIIPDVRYTPAPLRPAWTDSAPLDMSDSVLRSVSPIHMQYMQNMGVRASASISIVKDGVLWGLIACHHRTPRALPYDVRIACAALAGGLARQIRAKEDADLYRERIRLRSFEDSLIAALGAEASLDKALADHMPELSRMLLSDGAGVLRGEALHLHGITPSADQVRVLADLAIKHGQVEPLVTDNLSSRYPETASFAAVASGLLAIVVSAEEPFVMMWFRAEQIQVVEWAGNPHKGSDGRPGEQLSPRASFEAWRETVRGRSKPWSLAELEASSRLCQAILELRQRQRLVDLNYTLTDAVAAKDALIAQKEFLLGEVNHRIQNSLQLVGAFLTLQSKTLEDEAARQSLAEAQRRINAVAMVHRRLYRSDQIELIDLARYIEDLISEMLISMGAEWAKQVSLDLAPIMIGADQAVSLGLILTELVINANKYAYGGAPGPIEISLEQVRNSLRLVVSDRGRGKHGPSATTGGFGARMMSALVQQLGGELDYADGKPGVRAILTAPIAAKN